MMTGVGVGAAGSGTVVAAGAGVTVRATVPDTNVVTVTMLLARSLSSTRFDGSTIAVALIVFPWSAVTFTAKVNPVDPPEASGGTLQVTEPPPCTQFGPTDDSSVPVGMAMDIV